MSATCSESIHRTFPCYWRRGLGEAGDGTVARSHPERRALKEQIIKWWHYINCRWRVPGRTELSRVRLPEERLSGSERDRKDGPLTLSVSGRGGLGEETPSPTDTQINTLPVYSSSAGTQPDNKTDGMTQWGRWTEWAWSPQWSRRIC